jgi:hypothetical protein
MVRRTSGHSNIPQRRKRRRRPLRTSSAPSDLRVSALDSEQETTTCAPSSLAIPTASRPTLVPPPAETIQRQTSVLGEGESEGLTVDEEFLALLEAAFGDEPSVGGKTDQRQAGRILKAEIRRLLDEMLLLSKSSGSEKGRR